MTMTILTSVKLVALGAELMADVAGPHFTFVDPRNHDNAREMVKQALRLMRLFARKGYRRDRIVVSVSSRTACPYPRSDSILTRLSRFLLQRRAFKRRGC